LHWHGDGLQGTFELTDDAEPIESDAWIVADAKLAVMLGSEIPSELETSQPFVEIERLIAVA
jgi:hypothetical protein